MGKKGMPKGRLCISGTIWNVECESALLFFCQLGSRAGLLAQLWVRGNGDSAWQPRIRDVVEGAVIVWLSHLINVALEVFRSSSPQNILVKSVSSPTRSYQKYFIYTAPPASDKEITMLIFSSWLSTELVILLGSPKCQCLQYPCGTFWYQKG